MLLVRLPRVPLHHTAAWFVWTGSHWQKNETRMAFSWARRLTASLNREAEFRTKAVTGRTAFAAGVERFAQADECFAVISTAWDQDPWLLGTPAGTVDLRTGQLREAIRGDGITKIAAVAPAPVASCPRWLQFLHEATAGDAELIAFLQRWSGYCLTGDTREHALLFVHGPGGNGKSVFLATLAGIMGDYARTAPMETFAAGGSPGHPTELAMLRGARLVTASETEEGRHWAESRIKQLTGGDMVSARFMRQDFFEFRPQFKLTIVGNHKPTLRSVDEAARRRFNIVPFPHKPASPDKELGEKLRGEWPGILRWMIEGCLAWQEEGITRPAVVREATEEYFTDQDVFGAWAAERCIFAPNLSSRPSVLLSDYNAWAERNGEQHGHRNRLRTWAERQPRIRYKKVKGVDFVQGIGLHADADQSRFGSDVMPEDRP
jgi:putative DNA primase/helicase